MIISKVTHGSNYILAVKKIGVFVYQILRRKLQADIELLVICLTKSSGLTGGLTLFYHSHIRFSFGWLADAVTDGINDFCLCYTLLWR